MEFRCSKCGHVGLPDEMKRRDGDVLLVCSQCGAENELGLEDEEEEPEDVSTGTAVAEDNVAEDDYGFAGLGFGGESRTMPTGTDKDRDEIREAALERLVPETGEGYHCRKCARLLPEDVEHCPRCGLDQKEAAAYAPGEAPWEQPPVGQEEAFREAEQLWSRVLDDSHEERISDFVTFVRSEALFELGVRTLQFHLIEHPNDEEAVDGLSRLSDSMSSQFLAARTRAEADAEEFQEEIGTAKTYLTVALVVFWAIAFVIVAGLFFDNCGAGGPW